VTSQKDLDEKIERYLLGQAEMLKAATHDVAEAYWPHLSRSSFSRVLRLASTSAASTAAWASSRR
jgi:hypothetical protein